MYTKMQLSSNTSLPLQLNTLVPIHLTIFPLQDFSNQMIPNVTKEKKRKHNNESGIEVKNSAGHFYRRIRLVMYMRKLWQQILQEDKKQENFTI